MTKTTITALCIAAGAAITMAVTATTMMHNNTSDYNAILVPVPRVLTIQEQLSLQQTSSTTVTQHTVESLTDATFAQYIGKKKYVVIDCYTTWCGPCKQYAPIFEEASRVHTDVGFGKVDIEQNRSFDTHYNILAVPTTIFFKDGKERLRHVGFMNKKTLETFIDTYKK